MVCLKCFCVFVSKTLFTFVITESDDKQTLLTMSTDAEDFFDERDEAVTDSGADESDFSEMEDEGYESEDDDYSYFDTLEQELFEGEEYKCAEMYLRCIANKQSSLITELNIQIESLKGKNERLCDVVKKLEHGLDELQKVNDSLKTLNGEKEVLRLMDENAQLKKRLEETLCYYMQAIGVKETQETREEQEDQAEEYVTYLGIQLTHQGNRIVKHEPFEIDAIMKQNEEHLAREREHEHDLQQVMEKAKTSEKRIKDENKELKSTVGILQEALTKYSPRICAAEQKAIAHQEVNRQLEQRNKQLEEQLRRVSACVGSAFGTGEQTLMERARGVPGLLNYSPVHITLSVTQK